MCGRMGPPHAPHVTVGCRGSHASSAGATGPLGGGPRGRGARQTLRWRPPILARRWITPDTRLTSINNASPGPQVDTDGRIQEFPWAPMVVAGTVTCTLELCDLDDRETQRLVETIVAEAKKIGATNKRTFAYRKFVTHESAWCDALVRGLIRQAAEAQGCSTRSLSTGAEHDAPNMGRICSMGTVVPSTAGVFNHAPSSFSKAVNITNGANVLTAAVLRMDVAALSEPVQP